MRQLIPSGVPQRKRPPIFRQQYSRNPSPILDIDSQPSILIRHGSHSGVKADRLATSASLYHCLVVVPTYNEALNIQRLISSVLAQGPQFDMLIVDDNSPDATGHIVEKIVEETPRVNLLKRVGKKGLGSAYVEGFGIAVQLGYSYICQMDADFSHQPIYLPDLLSKAEEEADVVIGSRNVPNGKVKNWSMMRKILSKGGSLYARKILGLPIHDCTAGYKCFRVEALKRINLQNIQSNGYSFQIELNYRFYQAKLRMKEIPIVFPDRTEGETKMSFKIVSEAALMVWMLRFNMV